MPFTNDLSAPFDRRLASDCVFLDFHETFQLVFHYLLCFKPPKLILDAHNGAFTENFLTNRLQFVEVNASDFPLSTIISGVPKGSLFCPLFIIHINEMEVATYRDGACITTNNDAMYH